MSGKSSMPSKVGSMNREEYRALTRTHLNGDEPAPVFGLAAKRLQQRPSYGRLNQDAVKAALSAAPTEDAPASAPEDQRPKPTRNDSPIARTPTGVAVSHKMFSSPQPDAKPVVIRRTTRANTVDAVLTPAPAPAPVPAPAQPNSTTKSVKIDAPMQPRERSHEQIRENAAVNGTPETSKPSQAAKCILGPKILTESECIAMRVADGTYVVNLETAVMIGATQKHRYVPSMNLKEFDRYVKSLQ